ncbi:MAG: sigma-70 family RNA polymerase sigma factor [Planctomycetes bacterium]|nr:sigma-70 family RNA polymerase sigma factor [Planctomycetota bacterium]
MSPPQFSELAIEADQPARAEAAVAFDFATVVERYESPLLRYVVTVLGRAMHEAEDVVQDTFLRLHRQVQAQGPASIGDMSVWLYRVAHNVAMDVGRKRRVRKQGQQAVVEQAREDQKARQADGDEALADMIRTEAYGKALAAVSELPEAMRQVVMLKVIQGLTMKQIGEVLNTTPSNVHYRLHQAMDLLATRLKQQGVI